MEVVGGGDDVDGCADLRARERLGEVEETVETLLQVLLLGSGRLVVRGVHTPEMENTVRQPVASTE